MVGGFKVNVLGPSRRGKLGLGNDWIGGETNKGVAANRYASSTKRLGQSWLIVESHD